MWVGIKYTHKCLRTHKENIPSVWRTETVNVAAVIVHKHTIAHDGKRFNNGRPMFWDRVITVKTKSVSDSLLFGISLLYNEKLTAMCVSNYLFFVDF